MRPPRSALRSSSTPRPRPKLQATMPRRRPRGTARDGFQLGGTRSIAIPIVIDGENADATVTYAKDGAQVAVDGAAAGDGRQGLYRGT